MPITVEFFGIARRRAGVERLEIETATLGETFDCLAERLPAWADACLHDGKLRATFLVNRNGTEFLTERSDQLHDGDCLLILSADVGG